MVNEEIQQLAFRNSSNGGSVFNTNVGLFRLNSDIIEHLHVVYNKIYVNRQPIPRDVTSDHKYLTYQLVFIILRVFVYILLPTPVST